MNAHIAIGADRELYPTTMNVTLGPNLFHVQFKECHNGDQVDMTLYGSREAVIGLLEEALQAVRDLDGPIDPP